MNQKHHPQPARPQTPRQRAEALALACLLASLGALGLHAATQATNFDPAAATVGNARLLALAVTQYAQDYDERLPNTQSTAAFDTALRPYVPDPAVFVSRVTGKPFVPNAAISGKTLAEFADAGTVALFRDTLPPSRTPATIGYLDGHVERGGLLTGSTQDGSYQNAKALALGVLQYTQDNNAIYPPMKTQAAFQAAVLPYTRNSRVFVDPSSGKPFVPNPALSQVPTSSVTAPSQTTLFMTATPTKNGVSTTAYADGHVTPVPADLAPAPSAQDAGQLRQIGLATAQFAQDNNETLPTTTDDTAFENQLSPYLGTTSVFTSPGSGLPYRLNPDISGVSLAAIADPASTEEARDAVLSADGVLNHLQLSGRVRQDFYFLPLSLLMTPDDETHLLWRSAAPQASLWTVLPGGIVKTPLASSNASAFSAGADGQIHLLGSSGYGTGVSTAGTDGTLKNAAQYGVYDGWNVRLMTTGPDSRTRLLWQRTDGLLALWTLSSANDYQGYVAVPQLAGGTLVALAAGGDGLVRLLWKTSSGTASLWTLAPSGQVLRRLTLPSPAGQTPTGLSLGRDNASRLLWSDGSGKATVQVVAANGSSGASISLTLPGGTATQIAVGKSGDLRLLWRSQSGSGQLETLTAGGSQTSVQALMPYL